MKRPSFQFYPGDWQSNAKLKRCTHAERGIWLSVLCLMHDSEEYGVLRWPLREIAQAVGCRLPELRSIVARGVLKGADDGERCRAYVYTPRHAGKDGEPVSLLAEQEGPIWYSTRMVRDEYVRTKRGMGSRFGEAPKAAPKPPIGDGPSSSSSSSVLPLTPSGIEKRSKPRTGPPDEFDVSDAMAAWAVEIGVPAEILRAQTDKFLDHHRAKGSTFKDWDSAWRTWMRNAVEFSQRRAAHG